MKAYVRTPLHGSEYKVCNEVTDEVIAIFFDQILAREYADFLNSK